MTGHVVIQYRGYERTGYDGQRRRAEWWWFFTQPFVYSVWWKPDGSKTLEQFLDEQVRAVRAHLAMDVPRGTMDIHRPRSA